MDATPGIFKRIFVNPLALREIRQACRSWKLVVFLSVYLLIQGAIYAIWVYAQSNNGTFVNPTGIGQGLFITMAAVLVAVVMLVFPAFSSTAIASEHEKKSFDLLMLTPLAPWEIALGKFFAAAVQASVFLIATVPLFAMANMFGGIDPAVFFVMLWVLVLFSVFISFLGVYASSLVTRAIPAVLVTYLFAFVFGLVLLVAFIVLSIWGVWASAAFPLIGFFVSPTLGEGAYYLGSMTATCAIYCVYLFISTTNRLKPTSHNKSTNLRIFWMLVMLVVPAQIGGYFLITRLSTYGITYGTLITGAVYLSLLLLAPALTFPAEPPIASRRVRREMEKAPQAMMKSGGSLFFPGSMRGALHTSLLAALGLGLLLVAGSICFSSLRERNADRTQLVTDYREIVTADLRAAVSRRIGTVVPPGLPPPLVTPAGAPVSEPQMREALDAFYTWEYKGFALAVLAMLIAVLVATQVTWRVSLSGLSRGISSVLAALVIVVWLAVPYIAQAITGNMPEAENRRIAQFSPINGISTGVDWGTFRARSQLAPAGSGERFAERAGAAFDRWLTFMIVSSALGLGLLASNLFTYRRVLRTFAQATAQPQQAAQPVQYAPQYSPAPAQPAPAQQPPAGA